MDLLNLRVEIQATLTSLHVAFKEVELIRGSSIIFTIDAFGVVVCGIDRTDYTLVKEHVLHKFPEWRAIYLTTEDNLWEKKNDIIWDLMRSGYMRYIRSSYQHQFKHLITMQDFGKQIINKRLEIWGDQPKYKWLVEEHKRALREGGSYLHSVDPSFFDFMPEEEE